MKIIIEENEEKMSEKAMFILLGAMMQDKRVNISITSGTSPKTLYKLMVPYVKNRDCFQNVDYWLFDDNPYIGREHGKTWDETHAMFFDPAGIPDEKIHIPSLENWDRYDDMIRDAGGIDVMVLGLGWDGHFCNNFPRCTVLDSYTYCFDYKKRQELNPFYPDRPNQPTSLSMGPKSLMRVKHLVMIVNGKKKAEILKRVLDTPITDEIPATVLKLHPNFTIICDKEAASLL